MVDDQSSSLRFGSKAPAHPLDRPVWSALTTRQASLAQGGGEAMRMAPEYGLFAASADLSPAGVAALAKLEIGDEGLGLVETAPVAAPLGLVQISSAACAQMIADEITPGDPSFAVVELGEADAPEMLALARLTRPGPFFEATHRLGRFVGVRMDGRLAAMAGERMKPAGFTEVSGVCTHPDHRRRGYAAGLMRMVARRILARGETPFLHAYQTNASAIALYGRLGFRIREQVFLTLLQRGDQGR